MSSIVWISSLLQPPDVASDKDGPLGYGSTPGDWPQTAPLRLGQEDWEGTGDLPLAWRDQVMNRQRPYGDSHMRDLGGLGSLGLLAASGTWVHMLRGAWASGLLVKVDSFKCLDMLP